MNKIIGVTLYAMAGAIIGMCSNAWCVVHNVVTYWSIAITLVVFLLLSAGDLLNRSELL